MGISRDQGRQPATAHGMGTHYASPTKKRPGKRKTQVLTTIAFDTARKRQRLASRIEQIMSKDLPVMTEEDDEKLEGYPQEIGDIDEQTEWAPFHGGSEAQESFDHGLEDDSNHHHHHPSDGFGLHTEEEASTKKKRITPDQATLILYEKWKTALPSLVDDLLVYTTVSSGIPLQPAASELTLLCPTPTSCPSDEKSTNVTCLYFDRKLNLFFKRRGLMQAPIFLDFKTITIIACSCRSLSQILVRNGLFPTAPSQIRMAVSIDLLDFYAALFERSCDAVNAMAAALNTFYTKRGYYFLNDKV
jgi:hypothetical protein